MSLFDEIDAFCGRVEGIINQNNRRDKIGLYAEGLKSKVRQSDFALHNLEALSLMTDTTTTSTDSSLDTFEQVAFFCDSFCVFLYSSLDVLAQVINQVMNINTDERQVSFLQIEQYLSANHSGHPVTSKCKTIKNSRAFKNLHKYRNCSAHRRSIFIQQTEMLVRQTSGYAVSTRDFPTPVRIICDDPYDMNPKIAQNRIIPDYLEDLRSRIINEMTNIIKVLA